MPWQKACPMSERMKFVAASDESEESFAAQCRAFGISRKTVDVHKTRLMKKLDVHNRAELVRFAMHNHMLDD